MNYFLLVFLLILLVYSAIWVILCLRFYYMAQHSATSIWYIPIHLAQNFWIHQIGSRNRASI